MSFKRKKDLDGIRAIAILCVVFYHFGYRYGIIFKDISFSFFKYGFLGVQLFFILSGIVICGSAQRSINLKYFILKRIIRLYPVFWICCLVLFPIMLFFKDLGIRYDISIYDFILNLSMIPAKLGVKYIDGAFWSLYHELYFYFFFSVLYFLLKKIFKSSHFDTVFTIVLLFIFIKLISVLFIFSHFPVSFTVNKHLSLFIIGACLYLLRTYGELKKSVFFKNKFIIYFNLVILVFISTHDYSKLTDSTYYTIFVFIILISFFFIYKLKYLNLILSSSIFKKIALISYPWYLIHQNLGYIIIYKLKSVNSLFISISIAISITFSIAWLINKFLEKPITTHIKSKFGL